MYQFNLQECFAKYIFDVKKYNFVVTKPYIIAMYLYAKNGTRTCMS